MVTFRPSRSLSSPAGRIRIGTLRDQGSSPTPAGGPRTRRRTTSVLSGRPLSYTVLSGGCRCRFLSAVHESSSAGRPLRAPSTVPAGSAARATPPRSAEPSTPRVRLHLKPGQKGTKQLLAQYGDRLICVRYRYDAQRKKRLKTVELLVAERDWDPPRPRIAHDQLVELRAAFADLAVREQIKKAGGTWNPERKLWQLRYDHAVALGLTGRIVNPPASNTGCPPPGGRHLHADAPPAST